MCRPKLGLGRVAAITNGRARLTLPWTSMALTSLSLQPEDSRSAGERRPERGSGRGFLLVLLLLMAVGLGAGGYLLLMRMQALEQQVADLSARTGMVEAR